MQNAPVDSLGEIVLCVLPYDYAEHIRRWESSLWDLSERRWNAKLKRQGWSVSGVNSGRLEHKYLSISYEIYSL